MAVGNHLRGRVCSFRLDGVGALAAAVAALAVGL